MDLLSRMIVVWSGAGQPFQPYGFTAEPAQSDPSRI